MLMYERSFSTHEYKIVATATSREDILLSADQYIELVSPTNVRFSKDFVQENDKIFCRNKIKGCSGHLKAIRVERMADGCDVFTVLKKLFPSVFDVKFVRKINMQNYLYSNRSVIIESAISVLGRRVVEEIHLWDRINWCYGESHSSSSSNASEISASYQD